MALGCAGVRCNMLYISRSDANRRAVALQRCWQLIGSISRREQIAHVPPVYGRIREKICNIGSSDIYRTVPLEDICGTHDATNKLD